MATAAAVSRAPKDAVCYIESNSAVVFDGFDSSDFVQVASTAARSRDLIPADAVLQVSRR